MSCGLPTIISLVSKADPHLIRVINLEVTANDEEVYAIPAVDLTRLFDRGIDGMKSTMTLSAESVGAD